MDTCCFGCTERKLGCHSTCEKYKIFKEKLYKIYTARWENARNKRATVSKQKSIDKKIKNGK